MPTSLVRSAGLLTLVTTFVAAAPAPAAAFDLSTPEKAMALVNKALFDGDAAALKAAAVLPPNADDLFKSFVKRGQSLAAARKAVSDKFGFVKVGDFPRLLHSPLPMETKMLVTGSTARLLVASEVNEPKPIPVAEFQKTGNNWQQLLTQKNATKAMIDGARFAGQVESLVIDGFTKELLAGKFTDVGDASSALNSRIRTLNNVIGGTEGEANSVAGWFLFGIGVEKNLPIAFRIFSEAAEHGDAQSMADVGQLYERGEGTKKDPAAAFKWYTKAAAAKNPLGRFYLARAYQTGTGTKKDVDKAFPLMLEAVKGYPYAAVYLGDTYRDGLGTKADDAAALKYYEQAVDNLKSTYAMLEAAACYERGRGVKKDKTKAFRWRLRAAEAGDDDAMFELARRAEFGIDADKNPAYARMMYEKAAKAGNKDAAAWVKAHPATR